MYINIVLLSTISLELTNVIFNNNLSYSLIYLYIHEFYVLLIKHKSQVLECFLHESTKSTLFAVSVTYD